MTAPLYAALEAGGTKMNCAIGHGHERIIARARFATTRPDENLAQIIGFFRDAAAAHGPLTGLGVGSFGPLDLDPASPQYGHIVNTPKPGWSDCDLLGNLARALMVPAAMDTDVNGAALAEHRWGAGRHADVLVYVTIGTGIGGGVLVDGKPLHGLFHPEIGHMRLPRQEGDDFAGHCPFHGDCLEGMASGPAIAARWGKPGVELEPEHPAWALQARYVAMMCLNLSMTLSPKAIILGGGVMMGQPGLIDAVRQRFDGLMAGYLPVAERAGGLEKLITTPGLGDDAGLAGAFALAENATR
ncbi:MAG: ROK family protein [Sphingomonadales bacterium]